MKMCWKRLPKCHLIQVNVSEKTRRFTPRAKETQEPFLYAMSSLAPVWDLNPVMGTPSLGRQCREGRAMANWFRLTKGSTARSLSCWGDAVTQLTCLVLWWWVFAAQLCPCTPCHPALLYQLPPSSSSLEPTTHNIPFQQDPCLSRLIRVWLLLLKLRALTDSGSEWQFSNKTTNGKEVLSD